MSFVDNSENGKRAIKQATIRWLFQACLLVQGQAVLLAPVRLGNLKNSIDYVVDESELIGYIGARAEYAVFVEFGTGEFAENGQGRKGGWVYKDPSGEWHFTYGQAPQPYLRPAFRKNRARIMDLATRIYGEI